MICIFTCFTMDGLLCSLVWCSEQQQQREEEKSFRRIKSSVYVGGVSRRMVCCCFTTPYSAYPEKLLPDSRVLLRRLVRACTPSFAPRRRRLGLCKQTAWRTEPKLVLYSFFLFGFFFFFDAFDHRECVHLWSCRKKKQMMIFTRRLIKHNFFFLCVFKRVVLDIPIHQRKKKLLCSFFFHENFCWIDLFTAPAINCLYPPSAKHMYTAAASFLSPVYGRKHIGGVVREITSLRRTRNTTDANQRQTIKKMKDFLFIFLKFHIFKNVKVK